MYMYIILTRRPLIKLILLLYLFLDAVIFSAILKKAAKCSFIPRHRWNSVPEGTSFQSVHVCLTVFQVPPQSSYRFPCNPDL